MFHCCFYVDFCGFLLYFLLNSLSFDSSLIPMSLSVSNVDSLMCVTNPWMSLITKITTFVCSVHQRRCGVQWLYFLGLVYFNLLHWHWIAQNWSFTSNNDLLLCFRNANFTPSDNVSFNIQGKYFQKSLEYPSSLTIPEILAMLLWHSAIVVPWAGWISLTCEVGPKLRPGLTDIRPCWAGAGQSVARADWTASWRGYHLYLYLYETVIYWHLNASY